MLKISQKTPPCNARLPPVRKNPFEQIWRNLMHSRSLGTCFGPSPTLSAGDKRPIPCLREVLSSVGDTAGANDKSRHRCRGAARKTLTVKRRSGELRRRSWKKTASLVWEGQERSQLSPRAGPEMTQSDQTTLAKKLTAQKKILPII